LVLKHDRPAEAGLSWKSLRAIKRAVGRRPDPAPSGTATSLTKDSDATANSANVKQVHAPGEIRTRDLALVRDALYPLSYGGVAGTLAAVRSPSVSGSGGVSVLGAGTQTAMFI
jgi:hypothetical protein